MTEQIPENNHPVNQVSKRLLREAGEQPNPTMLYAPQLMRWSLDKGNHGLPEKFRAQISAFVNNLQGAPPANAMKWLLDSPNEPGTQILSPADLEDRSPREAAQNLLETVHAQAGMRLPGYNASP